MEFGDGISPKSVVASGTGLFAAQNMMYRHTITLYNKSGELIAKISDEIDLKAHGFSDYQGDSYLGGPVEACFSKDGNYLWVSNYTMSGDGFNNPGCDACNGKGYDPGFIYKINTQTFQIEKVIKVGAVPKYLAITPDEKKMVVSNWSSGDVSIVDLATEKEIKKVDVGAHPRGVAISSDSKWAYITVMGSTKIARINLTSYEKTYITNVGKSPRHVVLSSNDSLLYISLNSGNSLLKYCISDSTHQYCTTNAGPRSMVLSPDQHYLYVVNYFADTFSKIRTDSMQVVEVVKTGHHPIGITANWEDSEIWVACYEGKIEIFKDFKLAQENAREDFIFEQELDLFLSLFQPVSLPKNSSDQNSDELDFTRDDEANIITTTSEDEPASTPVGKGNINSLSKLDASKLEKKKTDDSNTTTSTVKSGTGCSYHVIVGSFSIYENAVNYQAEITGKGYEAKLIPNAKGMTYVSAACFETKTDAENAISSIYQDLDIKGWVLHQ